MRPTTTANFRGILVTFLFSILALPCFADQYLLVNGQTSDNLIKFDLSTGASSLYGQYQSGAHPRNLAIDSAGNLYSSLNGGNLNVVKFVPQQGSSVLGTTNFTASAGGDGPGQIQFYNGDLYVAGDESRVIFQYNGTTGGTPVSQFSSTTSFNIRAMVITGNTLYYEEAFQNTARVFDLTNNPPTGTTLFQNSPELAKAVNMTIGPQGILVFANSTNTLVQEYSNTTGVFLGTLANVATFNSALTSVVDVLYSPSLENYFVSAGNEVFRLDVNGQLLQTYTSDLIDVATGVLIVPEPSTGLLAAFGFLALAWCFRRRD
jgi:hypothetical protein